MLGSDNTNVQLAPDRDRRQTLSMAASLLDEIRRLSISERIQLVEDVWDSIATEGEAFPMPESHRVELGRRRQEHRDHPEDIVPWEEVRAQLWAEE